MNKNSCQNSAQSFRCFLVLFSRTFQLLAFKGEGGRVDAVTEASGAGTVGEDMPHVASAAGAGDFDAAHAVTSVFVLGDGMGVGRNRETWPAAARVEFGVALKEERSAAGAVVVARLAICREGSGEGAFGSLLAQDLKLLLGENRAPFGVAADDLSVRFAHESLRGFGSIHWMRPAVLKVSTDNIEPFSRTRNGSIHLRSVTNLNTR